MYLYGAVPHIFFMEVLAVVSSVLGVCGALIGLISWYSSAVRKAYAAEREFLHLKALINSSFGDIENEVMVLNSKVESIHLLLLEIHAKNL